MLVVASIFRDAESYVGRYFEQVNRLREEIPLRLVIAEGDSTDDTMTLLERGISDEDTLLKVDHGGPKFESYDIPQRWSQIAYVCNTVLDHLKMDDDDRLIYVESDLAWAWDTMTRLHDNLDMVGAVAAMSWQPSTGVFYDVWGHIGIDGKQFTHHPPHHAQLDGTPYGRLVPILSAGSCIAVRGEVINAGVRFSDDDCIRGFCRTIRDHTTLYLDTGAEVFHV